MELISHPYLPDALFLSSRLTLFSLLLPTIAFTDIKRTIQMLISPI